MNIFMIISGLSCLRRVLLNQIFMIISGLSCLRRVLLNQIFTVHIVMLHVIVMSSSRTLMYLNYVMFSMCQIKLIHYLSLPMLTASVLFSGFSCFRRILLQQNLKACCIAVFVLICLIMC